MTDPRHNLLASVCEEVKTCRHQLHQNPATAYEEFFASDLIARKLSEWGIPFERGWAETGIVATIEGHATTSGKRIGLRADFDALDIQEESGQEWASQIAGKMHACGHDGHTSILLGVARFLQETKAFNGTVHLFFQPAEEREGGALRMIEQGLFKKYPVESVYALHNWPYMKRGKIGLRAGPMMASSDIFTLTVTGHGGHAAMPHKCIDPIWIASQIVIALQGIASRNTDPLESAVVSITNFHGGSGASNIIPETVSLLGTARAFQPTVRDQIERRIGEIARGVAAANGGQIEYNYVRSYDPTINSAAEAAFCAEIAQSLFGAENVDTNTSPTMGAEDFGAMLKEKPGCYVFFGQGEDQSESPHNFGLHHPRYDFNDAILPDAIRYFVSLSEKKLTA